MGGDSNTSSAMEYNSSWASTYAAEVIKVTEKVQNERAVIIEQPGIICV